MPFRRRRDLPDVCEASRAIERAEASRDEAEARWIKVRSVVASMRTLKKGNHFIEGFRATLKEKP